MEASIIKFFAIIAVIITSVFSLIILTKLKNIKKTIVKKFMSIFCLGVIFYGIGKITLIFNKTFPSWADLFFIFGLLFIIISFGYLYAKQAKRHLSIEEKIFFIAVLTLIILTVFYLLYNLIIPEAKNLPKIETVLSIFYPLASATIFLLIYITQTYNKVKHGYLFYIMTSFFLIFLADMLATYSLWKGVYGILGIAYDLLYLLGYLFLLAGIYLFFLRLKILSTK